MTMPVGPSRNTSVCEKVYYAMFDIVKIGNPRMTYKSTRPRYPGRVGNGNVQKNKDNIPIGNEQKNREIIPISERKSEGVNSNADSNGVSTSRDDNDVNKKAEAFIQRVRRELSCEREDQSGELHPLAIKEINPYSLPTKPTY